MLHNRARLLTSAESGNIDAFVVLYDQYGLLLYRFLFRLTGHEFVANELLVATFRRAFREFRKRPRDIMLDTWLYRMAAATFAANALWPWRASRAPKPVQIEGRSAPWLQATVRLPPRLRMVWVLTLAERMPRSQAAEVLNWSLDQVHTRLDRAYGVFVPPDEAGDRPTIERNIRLIPEPRPGGQLRSDVAIAVGAGDAVLRTRIIQGGVALLILVLVVAAGFSVLRDDVAVNPADATSKPGRISIFVLGETDTGVLLILDPTSQKILQVIGIGPEPQAVRLSATAKELYVLQREGVLTIDVGTQRATRLLPLPSRNWETLAVAGRWIAVGTGLHERVAIADMKEHAVVATATLPWPVRELVPLNATQVIAVAQGAPEIARVSLDTATVEGPLSIGRDHPIGTVVSSDGATVYVTKPLGREVWQIQLDSRRLERLTNGSMGRAVNSELSPDGQILYLAVPERAPTAQGPQVGGQRVQTRADIDQPAVVALRTDDGSVQARMWQRGGVSRLMLDQDSKALYALAPASHALMALDPHSLRVRNAIPLGIPSIDFVVLATDS